MLCKNNGECDKVRAALAPLFTPVKQTNSAAATAAPAATPAPPPLPTKLTPMNPWQFRFTYMVGLLIAFAYNRGYTLTFGNARTDRSCTVCGGGKRKASSLHFDGLAIDLNLFKDGKYLPATADHRELGEYWESLGGCWGGRFNDGNHYSLAYNGRK